MERREFVKLVPLTALGAGLATHGANAEDASAQAGSQQKDVPDIAKKLAVKGEPHSDMTATGADGKAHPGFKDRAGANNRKDPKAPYNMPLTKEEQDIMDGKKGPELAKVMKIVVAHGNAFGAEKLVDLGSAPHCSLYTGTDYMKPMIDLFAECAKAGLKTYAPYTVNPRCYDLYNVNNNEKDMQLIYEGYTYQRDLDWVHAQLGAPDLNFRSCACYVPEVGNAPKPGTYVAWAESSAINYGNSALGIRTNRNAGGMELLCGLLGKAPLFGLMTDEGRMANWLVDVKTTKEPDLGVLGTAIGLKVIDGVPFITGMDKYLGTEVSNDNMHLLKKMGSATAASGAVGLYHVENLTPDAKEKGRKLLQEGYQTYVYDDAEEARVLGNFPTEKEGRPKDPTVCLIGCPHNTYKELLDWGTKVTNELEKRGLKTGAIPTKMFCSNVVRDHLVKEHPQLVGKMTQANMRFTNMCTVSYAGMKGFSERTFGVTNSPKTRLTRLPCYAEKQGKAIDFVNEVSYLIWSGVVNPTSAVGATDPAKGHWPNYVKEYMNRVDGLDYDEAIAYIRKNPAEIDQVWIDNAEGMAKTGHGGVPLMVINGEPFFGGDRFDQFVWRLYQNGLTKRPKPRAPLTTKPLRWPAGE